MRVRRVRPALGAALLIVASPAAPAPPAFATGRGSLPAHLVYPSGNCPGTLQRCINSVSRGDTVIVVEDSHDEGFISITKSLALKAGGAFHPMLDGVQAVGDLGHGLIAITVQGFEVDGSVSGYPADVGDSVTFRNLDVRQAPGDSDAALYADAEAPGTFVTMERNTVHGDNHQSEAIEVILQATSGTVDVRVVGNQVDNHGSSESGGGILVNNSDAGAVQAVVDGNSVWDVGQCGCGASPGIGIEGGAASGVTVADAVGNIIDRAQVVSLWVDVDDNGLGPQHLLTVHAFDNVITHAVEPLAILDGSPSRLRFDAGTSDCFADGTSDLSGHSPGTGNLAVDPRYYDAPFGNLRLKPASPLIDRGLVCSPGGIENLDAAGHGRLSGDGVDLGAFELGAGAPTGVALVGTSGADSLTGTAGADIVCGMGDSDTLKGGAGADWIEGGAGADRLSEGPGADRLFGGAGNDPCLNTADGHGGDSIDGGTGTDHYRSNQGDSVVHAAVRSNCAV